MFHIHDVSWKNAHASLKQHINYSYQRERSIKTSRQIFLKNYHHKICAFFEVILTKGNSKTTKQWCRCHLHARGFHVLFVTLKDGAALEDRTVEYLLPIWYSYPVVWEYKHGCMVDRRAWLNYTRAFLHWITAGPYQVSPFGISKWQVTNFAIGRGGLWKRIATYGTSIWSTRGVLLFGCTEGCQQLLTF